MLTKLDKLKKELEKVEKKLEKVRGCSSLTDGWQTMRLAKKQRSWDILGDKRTQLRWEIEELEQELASESICGCGDTIGLECICNYNIEEDEDEQRAKNKNKQTHK